MTDINRRVIVSIALDTLYATEASYDSLALVDDDLIPTDVRRLEVPANDFFDDVVGTSGTLYDICVRYFQTSSVSPPAEKIIFGRLIETASSPFFYCGSHESDYSVYALVTDGSYAVYDGTDTVVRTGLDFSSCTSFDDVLTVLNDDLATLVAPAITGLDTAEWAVDAIGRLKLTNSTTGSTADDISVISDATGTDLSTSTYFDVAEGASVSGLDAETLLEGYSAFKQLYDDFWGVFVRGGDDTELLALAAQIETEARHLFMFENTASAANPAATTDLAYVANAAGLKKCSAFFSYTGSYPDFAQVGGSIGEREEGSVAFGFNEIANEVDSGQAANAYKLTATQLAALEAKNYNWIETVAGFKNGYPGRSVAGQEIRLLLGRDWIANTIQLATYTARIRNRLLGFDNESLAVYEEIIRDALEQAKSRRIIQSYTMNMPDEDDFTAAQKATHEVELLDVFTAEAVTDGWKYTISGRITLG